MSLTEVTARAWHSKLGAFTWEWPCLGPGGCSPLSPLCQQAKAENSTEGSELWFPLGFPTIWSKEFSDKGSKFPSVTIWKFPNSPYLCCVCFGKSRRCPQIYVVSWRVFWQDCKTKSQCKSNCKQAFIYRPHAKPEQTQTVESKWEEQVKSSSRQPQQSPSSTACQVTTSNHGSKFNVQLLKDLKSRFFSLTRNGIKA